MRTTNHMHSNASAPLVGADSWSMDPSSLGLRAVEPMSSSKRLWVKTLMKRCLTVDRLLQASRLKDRYTTLHLTAHASIARDSHFKAETAHQHIARQRP